MISYDGHPESDAEGHASTRDRTRRRDPNVDSSFDAPGFIGLLRAGCHDAASELHEAGADLGRLVRIKIGRVQIKTRDFFLRVALLCFGAALLVGVLIASVVFILLGLAGGVAQLLGAGLWVGFLLVGLALSGLLLGGGAVLLSRSRKERVAALQETLEPADSASEPIPR